jgi:hypothetical protein
MSGHTGVCEWPEVGPITMTVSIVGIGQQSGPITTVIPMNVGTSSVRIAHDPSTTNHDVGHVIRSSIRRLTKNVGDLCFNGRAPSCVQNLVAQTLLIPYILGFVMLFLDVPITLLIAVLRLFAKLFGWDRPPQGATVNLPPMADMFGLGDCQIVPHIGVPVAEVYDDVDAYIAYLNGHELENDPT